MVSISPKEIMIGDNVQESREIRTEKRVVVKVRTGNFSQHSFSKSNGLYSSFCERYQWTVVISLFCSFWLTSHFGQVSCMFQESSMEKRNCSEFVTEEYPQIIVRHEDQEYAESFAINQTMLMDHQLFFFKCVARYPIEWINNEVPSTSYEVRS